LIAEIEKLQKAVVRDLQDRRGRLSRELHSVDVELAELAGELPNVVPAATEAKPRPRARAPITVPTVAEIIAAPVTRQVDLAALIAELHAAPDGTLNIRKAGLDVKHVRTLVKANPRLLRLHGKGAWPTVTLISGQIQEESAQGVFVFGTDATTPPKPRRGPTSVAK
jgi:hypothetical protein